MTEEKPSTTYTVLSGRISWFGGPKDKGVGPHEGLALYEQTDIKRYHSLFLKKQPIQTTGLARRLNPKAFYIACRWDYNQTSREYLRDILVKVKNIRTGKVCWANPVDWGPNEDTGRIADLSPGVLEFLNLTTDDIIEASIPLPEKKNVAQ